MSWLTFGVLAACTLCAAVGAAMTLLVLWRAPSTAENQVPAAYFLAFTYGASAVLLAHVLSRHGANVAPLLYESYVADSLVLLALLAVATHRAGLWRRRWVPLAIAAAVILVLAVQAPMMHGGRLFHFAGYGAEGHPEVYVTELGRISVLIAVGVGVAAFLVAAAMRSARALVPAIAAGAAGPSLHVLNSEWQALPLSVLCGTASVLLLGLPVLRRELRRGEARRQRVPIRASWVLATPVLPTGVVRRARSRGNHDS